MKTITDRLVATKKWADHGALLFLLSGLLGYGSWVSAESAGSPLIEGQNKWQNIKVNSKDKKQGGKPNASISQIKSSNISKIPTFPKAPKSPLSPPQFARIQCVSIPNSQLPCAGRYIISKGRADDREDYTMQLGANEPDINDWGTFHFYHPDDMGLPSDSFYLRTLSRGKYINTMGLGEHFLNFQHRPNREEIEKKIDTYKESMFRIESAGITGNYYIYDLDLEGYVTVNPQGYLVTRVAQPGQEPSEVAAQFKLFAWDWSPGVQFIAHGFDHVQNLRIKYTIRGEPSRVLHFNRGRVLDGGPEGRRYNDRLRTERQRFSFANMLTIDEIRYEEILSDGKRAKHAFRYHYDKKHLNLVRSFFPYNIHINDIPGRLEGCQDIFRNMHSRVNFSEEGTAGEYKLHVYNPDHCREECLDSFGTYKIRRVAATSNEITRPTCGPVGDADAAIADELLKWARVLEVDQDARGLELCRSEAAVIYAGRGDGYLIFRQYSREHDLEGEWECVEAALFPIDR